MKLSRKVNRSLSLACSFREPAPVAEKPQYLSRRVELADDYAVGLTR